MAEEAGIQATAGSFMGVVENSFLQHGKPHAEINLVYALELPGEDCEVRSQESWIEFFWCPLADLDQARLLPEAFNRLSEAASGGVFFSP